jgi:DNA-binding response OmpR family regulator
MKSPKKPLVFIVEDNIAYAEMINFYIQESNYDTQVFHSGEQCINNIHQSPDFVILDYMLGNMDGIEVLKQIKAINPDIQVIFLSGQEDINIGINSLKYGAYDYVIKNESAFDRLISTLFKIESLKSIMRKIVWRQKVKKAVLAVASVMVLVTLILQF